MTSMANICWSINHDEPLNKQSNRASNEAVNDKKLVLTTTVLSRLIDGDKMFLLARSLM